MTASVMPNRLLYLAPLLVFAVVAGYFVWGLNPSRDPGEIPSVLIDQPVPQFDLPPLAGVDRPGLSSADLEDGPVTLVNVFASWCIPCRAEHKYFMALAEADKVRLAGINYKDKTADAVRWLAELGNPYARIGADDAGRAGIEWGISGVPETFVIDRKGQIRYRHVGPLYDQVLEDEILPLVESLKR
jgi:cytochrome c biogenesis protein CcmG/thiol:disulfide interchange protein DsbE